MQQCLLGHVSFPLCVYELGLVCSQTQLCHIGVFNGYTRQVLVSAITGHLQVVLREKHFLSRNLKMASNGRNM